MLSNSTLNFHGGFMMKTLFTVLVASAAAVAQNIVPFASRENVIELAVQNTSAFSQENIAVEVKAAPAWISFVSSRQTIEHLAGTEEKTTAFRFSIDKSAPVGKEEAVSFTVSTSTGQTWTKEIKIAIAALEKFELFQNFPNPFNPTTAISYQLSADSRVTLRVFDLLGREVAALIDDNRAAGYHQETWDASRFSSGTYVYELVASSDQGKTVLRKTMLLVK